MVSQAELLQEVSGAERLSNEFMAQTVAQIGRSMVHDAARIKPGQRVLLSYDAPGLPLVRHLHDNCIDLGANVQFFKRDLERDVREIPLLDEAGIEEYISREAGLIRESDVVIFVRGPEDPSIIGNLPKDKASIYFRALKDAQKPLVEGVVDRTLFMWPTKYEAAIEGMTYEEYFRVVAEACDQPWLEIKAAQAKLIEKLNGGKILEFVANSEDPDETRRTKLTMSIEGMTFANSTAYKNYPGSEVFSAPVRNSVNGQMFAEGEYEYNGKRMRNIRFKIKAGQIVSASAEEGNEGLQEILDRDEGARYFGEIAIGTNKGLKKRLFNPLLNEKVGGSFHAAAGYAYGLKEYDGEQVKVDNGNRSINHWDITILMHPNTGGGRIILDGEVIQENGTFVDPDLAILNPDYSE